MSNNNTFARDLEELQPATESDSSEHLTGLLGQMDAACTAWLAKRGLLASQTYPSAVDYGERMQRRNKRRKRQS